MEYKNPVFRQTLYLQFAARVAVRPLDGKPGSCNQRL
jgi:hypothetical protein